MLRHGISDLCYVTLRYVMIFLNYVASRYVLLVLRHGTSYLCYVTLFLLRHCISVTSLYFLLLQRHGILT